MNSDLDEKNIDRISQLPDPILCHILSFLPTNLASRTSILATRWRYLWLSVSTIDIDESDLQYLWAHDSSRFDEIWPKYKDFVDRLLIGSNVPPPLQKLSLRFATDETCNDFLDTWVSAAIKRNVQELELTHLFNEDIQFPDELFTCKTLVTLKVNKISFENLGSVWLPCLKVLKIEDLDNGNEETLPKLFSDCPALEDLDIFRFVFGVPQNLTISVPTLKYLKLDDDDDVSDDNPDEPEEGWCKLVINAPRLEHLDLKDSLSKKFIFKNIPSLSKASVRVGHTSFINPSLPDRIYQLFGQLSHVKILNANLCISECTLPTFHRLTQLKIGGFEGSWNLRLLENFLHQSPKLETLTIEGVRDCHWEKPDYLPSCLSSSLKNVVIENFSGREYELKMIKYLLKNAKVLKKMTIHSECLNGYFYGALAAFPRGSKTCQMCLLF